MAEAASASATSRTPTPTWTIGRSTVLTPAHLPLPAPLPIAPTSAPPQPVEVALADGAPVGAPEPPDAPAPSLTSPDGRVTLTDTTLTVQGRCFLLLELERAELTPVRWILWYLLGGLGLAAVMIAFLQNWLRTGPAMAGMAITALLLAYGHRGTNRLRLHCLGREAVNFALPGETPPWQRLTAEAHRRNARAHDQSAREAAALLDAADAANRAAQLAELADPGLSPTC